MSTLRQPITDATDHDNPNVVKVVVDRHGDALYFSRSPIPYCREDGVCFKHIGLYAYRREFLLAFAALPQTRSNGRSRSSSCARSSTATAFARSRPDSSRSKSIPPRTWSASVAACRRRRACEVA